MALNCAVYRRFIHLGTAKQNADIKRGLWTAKVKERESARTQMADLRPVGDDFKPRRTDFMPVRPVRAEFWSVKGLYAGLRELILGLRGLISSLERLILGFRS